MGTVKKKTEMTKMENVNESANKNTIVTENEKTIHEYVLVLFRDVVDVFVDAVDVSTFSRISL